MKYLDISLLRPGSPQAIKKIMSTRAQEVREGKVLLERTRTSPFVAKAAARKRVMRKP